MKRNLWPVFAHIWSDHFNTCCCKWNYMRFYLFCFFLCCLPTVESKRFAKIVLRISHCFLSDVLSSFVWMSWARHHVRQHLAHLSCCVHKHCHTNTLTLSQTVWSNRVVSCYICSTFQLWGVFLEIRSTSTRWRPDRPTLFPTRCQIFILFLEFLFSYFHLFCCVC